MPGLQSVSCVLFASHLEFQLVNFLKVYILHLFILHIIKWRIGVKLGNDYPIYFLYHSFRDHVLNFISLCVMITHTHTHTHTTAADSASLRRRQPSPIIWAERRWVRYSPHLHPKKSATAQSQFTICDIFLRKNKQNNKMRVYLLKFTVLLMILLSSSLRGLFACRRSRGCTSNTSKLIFISLIFIIHRINTESMSKGHT